TSATTRMTYVDMVCPRRVTRTAVPTETATGARRERFYVTDASLAGAARPAGRSAARPRHGFGHDPLVELRLRQRARGDGRLTQREALLVRVLGDGGGLVVADVRVEGRHEHQVAREQLRDPLAVRLEALRAMIVEGQARVAEQR